MKVWADKSNWYNKYVVRIQQGNQYFTLDCQVPTLEEAEWMVKMFRKALDHHDEETRQNQTCEGNSPREDRADASSTSSTKQEEKETEVQGG